MNKLLKPNKLPQFAAVAGIIGGAVADIAWLLFFTSTITAKLTLVNTGVYEIVPGFIIGMLITVAVSLLTAPPADEVLAIYDTAVSADGEE